VSPSDAGWDERFVERIASEIRRLRTLQGVSAQALADKINALGHTMSRSTLADIENGRRKYVTVTELIVFARALDTAPVMLLFPGPYNDEAVEVLPGVTGYQLEVINWFCGEGTAPEQGFTGDEVEYAGNCLPLKEARELAELKVEKIGLEMSVQSALELEDEGLVQMYTRLLSSVNRRIAKAEADAR
jgi:transcriptional regulator with XRE-family HTH domain